ncbi:hypothetical protein AGMMS49975_17890 [Clostridia bacterium]|nr:hypothetical protein AGMMS49975_17890 [Clostridia bacterium]
MENSKEWTIRGFCLLGEITPELRETQVFKEWWREKETLAAAAIGGVPLDA